jgi:glycosyltransferase domain-containing protein
VLTVVLPTRNRADHCACQLRFLRDNGFEYPIVVLDGSDDDQAEAVRSACVNMAEYRRFDRLFRLVDKLATVVPGVATPYVVLIPDDDIVLPGAIAAALAFLQGHPDHVVAHGYFLSFGIENQNLENQNLDNQALETQDFDIHDVIGFTPSIEEASPLARHYHLFRRYQSFYWGVFRTNVFSTAVTAARAMNVVLFRELTVMSTSVLQGKVARLPMVYALEGAAPSHAAIHDSNPMFWLLRDAQSFFTSYLAFRDGIAQFIRAKGIDVPQQARLEQILDISHATYLGRELDLGMTNYTARLLLGDDIPPIRPDPGWPTRGQSLPDDLVHGSRVAGRRYVWRRRVTEAAPRSEIAIGPSEMAVVERQLDAYRPTATPYGARHGAGTKDS